MSKTRKKKPTYPPEYRQRIIDLYLSGRSISSLAADFEPCAATISSWVRKHEQQQSGDALSSDEREELQRLRKQVKRLEMERELLEKATAWFAQKTKL